MLSASLVMVACGGEPQGTPGGAGRSETETAPAAAPTTSEAPEELEPQGQGAVAHQAATDAPAISPDEAAPTDEAIASLLDPWKGDLKGMVERRYIRMLVTFSKSNYFLDRGRQYGLSYDAGKLFEDYVNKQLGSKTVRVHVAFLPVSRDKLLTALAEGRGDLAAANLTITPGRREIVDFTPPFGQDTTELVVTAPDQPAVPSPEALSGREVHVRKSSSYYESLQALNESLRAAGKAPVSIVEASEYLEDEDILEMVSARLIPATVVDNHIADLWKQVFTDIRVQPAVVRRGGQIAWAVRKGTPELQKMLAGFVRANSKGSANFNMLTRRYLKDASFVKNAGAQSEYKKFQETVAFFRKYGDQYDLPWLLVAAQAYQESGIDQSKKSHAGAVGVMQIKPTTAAGNPINIKGVDKSAEQNIHAGVKYLRWVMDRYFPKAEFDRLNRGLFAMAAYNAGPARVARLRTQAAKMGLDPDVWFGNVEIVAAREIGRETVQYVGNIYKYYLSYNLLSQQAAQRDKAKGKS
jgi:membrane-bound lytic murein transglycosylase MltF